MKLYLFASLLIVITMKPLNTTQQKCVDKNKMEVCWTITGNEINFKLKAPTNGWLCIGFNEKAGLKGTYLLMARVVNGKAEVVEHHTLSPGNYKDIQCFGEKAVVSSIQGSESNGVSEVRFSVPVHPTHKYAKPLKAGTSYEMLVAYSREDDFQHHSMMRSNIRITL
jgi:hypothetical protein